MTAEKLTAIKHYLRANGVKYYDVQAELIDHFATAIEIAERENPKLNFKENLIKAHRSFGGKEGFRKYMEAAHSRVQKHIWEMAGKVLLGFLTWPKIVLTAALVFIWRFYAELNINYSYSLLSMFVLLLAITLFNEWRLKDVDSFLARRSGSAFGWVAYVLCYIPGQAYLFGTNGSPAVWYQTALFTLFSLLLVFAWQLPTLVQEKSKDLYPV